MAESACILAGSRQKVYMPDPEAGCPMADMITGEQLRALKAQHPGAAVVTYVNSSAEVKAESDCCVTSANAVQVARSYASDQPIIFVPDRHLGSYTAEQLGRAFILWPGFCPTHQRITAAASAARRAEYPDAEVLVHPECTPDAAAAAAAEAAEDGIDWTFPPMVDVARTALGPTRS